MDALNIAAAIATIAALLLAIWQYLVARQLKQTERERIVLQRERLRTAVAAAMQGAEAANIIVQRAKEPDVTFSEVQNVARVIRGEFVLLTQQLEQERSLLAGWKVGKLMNSASPGTTDPDATLDPASGRRAET